MWVLLLPNYTLAMKFTGAYFHKIAVDSNWRSCDYPYYYYAVGTCVIKVVLCVSFRFIQRLLSDPSLSVEKQSEMVHDFYGVSLNLTGKLSAKIFKGSLIPWNMRKKFQKRIPSFVFSKKNSFYSYECWSNILCCNFCNFWQTIIIIIINEYNWRERIRNFIKIHTKIV